jgi:hypothetical protein
MPWMTAAAIVGSSLIGGYTAGQAGNQQAQAAGDAARVQSDASRYAANLQQKQYEENVQRQQPFYQAGVNALPELVQASKYTPFGQDQFQADPGYAFRLSEGQKALERTAAARGGLISGGALKAASRYGQDMGSQEYQNAYNRALTGYGTQVDRSNTAFSRGLTGYNADVARADTGYNRLASMAGVGQTTGQQLNTAGANYANTASNTLGNYGTAASNAVMGAGQATAAGQMGSANTLASALNTGVSSYLNQSNFNDWLRRQPARTV